MKKPLIGLIPLIDRKKDSYWMLPGYMKGISDAGGIPLMLDLMNNEEDIKQIVLSLDGFLFTGGHDISPALYNEQNKYCDEIIDERDQMEMTLLHYAIHANKSILGICRGLQMINVYCGGTLYQDLSKEYLIDVQHRMDAPYDRHAHLNYISSNSLLSHILNKEKICVNSCHHQAIKDLGHHLIINATSEDGLVEAVSMENQKFVLAVQWHPEFYQDDENAKKIFKAFIDSMKAD